MSQSSIEWTEMTWNPTTWCTKVSQGCKFCYAEIMSKRLQAMWVKKYKDNFEVRTHEDALQIPYTWKKSKIVFVNSMSDLFHDKVSINFIKKVFKVMNENPQHVFQVLTKRPERLSKVHKQLKWTHNIWMGVSVESQEVECRIDYLRNTDARVKFLSLEPLIWPLPNLNLGKIDWVIVWWESWHSPRLMSAEWVVDIQQKCYKEDVAFFFKQWWWKNKKKSWRVLNWRTYDEMPEIDLQHSV